jgi:hypothetical protein
MGYCAIVAGVESIAFMESGSVAAMEWTNHPSGKFNFRSWGANCPAFFAKSEEKGIKAAYILCGRN